MEVEPWRGDDPGPDGLITRMEIFFLHDEEEARAAAGLGSGGPG